MAASSVAVFVAGACTTRPPTWPPTTTRPTTPTTDGHGHTEHDHANLTTTTRPGGPPTTDGHGHTEHDHANLTSTTMGDHGMDHGGEHGHETPDRLNHPPTLDQKRWAFDFVKATNSAISRKTVCAAEREGYVNIGDSQHWTHGGYRNDGKNFDANAVESLVFPRGTSCRLRPTATPDAAMYNVEPGTNLNNIRDYAGNWFVYHGHDNLCWKSGVPKTDPTYWTLAICGFGGERREPVPMVHLWIKDTATARECGVFASIEGLGPGSCLPQLVPSRIINGTLLPTQV